MVKRDAGASLFQSGKEYVYRYSTSVSAGSSDYVSYASVYNITGVLHIQSNGNTLNVKLSDVQFGAHNGEFPMYPPIRIPVQTYEQLNPLAEPFQITLEHGKVSVLSISIFLFLLHTTPRVYRFAMECSHKCRRSKLTMGG